MKYRFIPVVSLFVSFPCWAFGGLELLPSTDPSTDIGTRDFPSMAGSISDHIGFGLTMEAGMIIKSLAFPDNPGISLFNSFKEKPELIQTVELTQQFEGMSVEVSRYANQQQIISFKSTVDLEATPRQITEGYLSDYQQLLYLLIAQSAYENLVLTYHEARSAFILSSKIKPEIKLKVPSQVDIANFPAGSLEGFTTLHQTALTDITGAWECYSSEASWLFVQTISCKDGSSFSWNEDEQIYIYEANAFAPVPPEFPFGLSQFDFDENWPLSGEYSLVFVNGKPEKVQAIGSENQSFSDEPMDGSKGSGATSTHKDTHSTSQAGYSQAGHNGSDSGHSVAPARAKKSRGSSGQGGDDPEERPTDYKRKAPESRYIIDESLPRTEGAIAKELKKINEQLKRDEHQLDTKWNTRDTYNSPKRREVERKVNEAKARRKALLGQLDAIEEMTAETPGQQPGKDKKTHSRRDPDHSRRNPKAKPLKSDRASTAQRLKLEIQITEDNEDNY